MVMSEMDAHHIPKFVKKLLCPYFIFLRRSCKCDLYYITEKVGCEAFRVWGIPDF